MPRPIYRTAAIAIASFMSLMLFERASQPRAAESAPPEVSQPKLRFSRDIRPILSQNCFLCHGLDENRRGGGLRLDIRELAMAELDSGMTAIVPGKPEESELVARITAEDEYLRMPPPDSHKTLKPEQIDLLKRWIAEGAEYEAHWSFIPLKRPEVPEATATSSKNSIDAFVSARLAQEQLAMSAEADRRTLIRRLSFDLTGLPPTPAEVEAFAADESADAYERLVDRLLSSPHFGERMAMDWLDAARYADTHGYHIDSHRDMWPWRDWVIKAFNENMPFDQFTIWQLAGDLLPEATVEQQIASGFNRNHPVNFEGGAIPEEYHVEYVVDRVTTTGTVWMGLTLGCARCHDHKYDPISQKEFFELFAFFNNVDEQGLDGYRGNAKPMLELPTDEQRHAIDALALEIADRQQRLDALEPKLAEAQSNWEKAQGAKADKGDAGSIRPGDWLQLGPMEMDTPEQAIAESFGVASPVALSEEVMHRGESFKWYPSPKIVDGKKADLRGESAAMFLLRHIDADAPTTVRAYVGASDAVEIRLNGELVWERREQTPFSTRQQQIELPLKAGQNELLVKLVNYSWEVEFSFAFDPAGGVSPPPNIKAVLAVAADKRTEEQAADLKAHFRASHLADEEYQKLAGEFALKQWELAKVKSGVTTTMVMQERAEMRPTHRLERGQYNAPAEELMAGTPAALPPLPEGEPANRLTLAKWLVSPEHPLTARVTVNRLWQGLFGTGLVKTSEDFGLQGQFPVHADLLDWLAVEFIESGWDVKHMLRLMVTSAAYRQTSDAAPALVERDPENELLARGPRFRMPAEMIRDLALATGGLLDKRIGGPSVKPYQPGDLWGELAHQKHNYKFSAQLFVQDHGADLYRRTMYTFWKRSVPPPNLNALDAPTRETCVVRRERTNTPLQALVLLNDPTFVEAGRNLAARMLKEGGGDARAKIHFAFELVTSRPPTAQEEQLLAAEYEKQLASFAADAEAAQALLEVGESPRDEALDAAAHAAWTNVALIILNLDEAITNS